MFERILKRLKRCIPLHIIATYRSRTLPAISLYEQLVDKYGQDADFYVQHYTGTGDVYLAASLLKKFVQDNNRSSNYVMTVIGGGNKKVAQLFDLEQVETLNQQQTDYLVRMSMFAGDKRTRMLVTHYHPQKYSTGVLTEMCSYKGTDFATMYLDASLPGMHPCDLTDPGNKSNAEHIEKVFEQAKLIPERTVLIAPYAVTTDAIPDEFWDKLVKHLKRRGYAVCTNSASTSEPALRGTQPVNISYADLRQFCEKCGYVIALRSGLCEIIASCSAKKVIIYPKINLFKFGNYSFKKYFSLENMKYGQNFSEIDFDNRKFGKPKTKRLLSRILEEFPNLNEPSSETGGCKSDD